MSYQKPPPEFSEIAVIIVAVAVGIVLGVVLFL